MNSMSQVQILEEAVYISLCANDFEKGMNPFLLFLYGDIVGQI